MLTVQPRLSYLTSLSLNLLMCKTRTVIVISQGIVRIHEKNLKICRVCPAHVSIKSVITFILTTL